MPIQNKQNSALKNAAIRIQDLSVAYHEKPVLWDIDLELPEHQLIAIVGPNGAGKTTLLKSMLGLIKPAAGSILLFDKPLESVRKRIAYVPQRRHIDWDFPTSVLDVVLMGRYGHLGWFKRPGKKDRELAFDALKQVEMDSFYNRQINELSGGQQQRVFLARALVQEADLYVLDEPFVGIDDTTKLALVSLLKSFKAQGKTVVVVHHDLHTLEQFFDWLVLLNIRLITAGPVSECLTKEHLTEAFGDKNHSVNIKTN
tara:strand:- start:501 stop:1271 length:771 start_codon:yes stop_codon:yes gene_type:complete